jgi:hypothetical protein
MESKDEQSAAIEVISDCWIKSGCSLSMVAAYPEWGTAVENTSRFEINKSCPELRAMLIAAAVIHAPDQLPRVCRSVIVANESQNVDNYRYYTKVLHLLYVQSQSALTRARLLLAMDISPNGNLTRLYEEEFHIAEGLEKSDRKCDKLDLISTKRFLSDLFEVISRGATSLVFEFAEDSYFEEITNSIKNFADNSQRITDNALVV